MKRKKSIVLLFSMLSLFAVKIDLKNVLASSSKELFQGYSTLDNISNVQLEIETNTIQFSRKEYTSLTFDYSLTNANYETEIEHGRNKTDTTPKTYSFEFTINLSDLTNDNGFYIMYSARGFASDDWQNNNLKVTITSSQEKGYHMHKNVYTWATINSHFANCYCGNEVYEHYVVRSSNSKKCILCGGPADMELIITENTKSIKFVTRNGSYILPNGIIVLVDEDIEAFMNGTLVFYNKDEAVS